MWQPKKWKKQQFCLLLFWISIYVCEIKMLFLTFCWWEWYYKCYWALCDCKAQVIKSFFGLIWKYMGLYSFWCVKVNIALLTMQLLVNIRPINKLIHVINLTLSMLVKNQAHRWNWCWVNRNSYFLSRKSNFSIPSIEKTYIIITKSWSNL